MMHVRILADNLEGVLMRRTVVNARGQVTIPVELRKQLEITPGTRVTWFEEEGRLMVAPMTARRIREIRGFQKPKPGEPSMFEELFKERASGGGGKTSKRRGTMPSSRKKREKRGRS